MWFVNCNHTYGSENGFSLMELVISLGIIGLLSAVAVPQSIKFYGSCCLRGAAFEIVQMIREAKMKALQEHDYAIHFQPPDGNVTLISSQGPDGKWNTADDTVVRSFRLGDKGGGVRFGYGSYGPVPGIVKTSDGLTFGKPGNRIAVFNEDLSGSSGTVFLISSSGSAIAIVVSSVKDGYTMHRWNGRGWKKY